MDEREDARELTSTDATMPGSGDGGAGRDEIGRAGQRAQSGETQLATEQGRTPRGRGADAGATTPEDEPAGPAGTPGYGTSGHEGLGAEGAS